MSAVIVPSPTRTKGGLQRALQLEVWAFAFGTSGEQPVDPAIQKAIVSHVE
jgi:hypothetical protein